MTWPGSSGVLAISSSFSPSWKLMEYWCNWVCVDDHRRIKHRALFWSNQLRNQANACTILSSLWTSQRRVSLEKVALINKTEHCWRQPKKDTHENLTTTPLSYINDASVDLNKVCLHVTYLFLKELHIASDVFLLALLSHENLQSLPEVVWKVFSPESTPLVIQQSPLPT